MRLGLVLGVLAMAFPLSAQDALFDEANLLYQNGDYAGALDRYHQILDDGYESSAVYYNIGNAFFKSGELGLAIINYERAARLAPGNDDILANLELARSLTTDDITPLPDFLPIVAARAWVNLLPDRLLQTVVGALYTLTMLSLALGTYLNRPVGFRVSTVAGVLTIVFGLNLLLRESGLLHDNAAIVMSESASVMSAPSTDSELQLFTIHEGTRVRIDQLGEEWSEIVLEDGRVGWIRSGAIEQI